jgi:hypothetical protein
MVDDNEVVKGRVGEVEEQIAGLTKGRGRRGRKRKRMQTGGRIEFGVTCSTTELRPPPSCAPHQDACSASHPINYDTTPTPYRPLKRGQTKSCYDLISKKSILT